MMKRILLVLFVFFLAGAVLPVQAAQWPYYSFDITKCDKYDCSLVYYDNAQTSWRSIADNLKSSIRKTQLTIWGVHCDKGDLPGNFFNCVFLRSTDGAHTPELVSPTECQTTQPDNWIIANEAACVANVSFQGSHNGALPGAECGILGKAPMDAYSITSLDTPYGVLTAAMVANSRDTYCGKTLPPSINCDISIPNGGLLDHGTQTPNSQSERELDVSIECGPHPVITIIDPTLKMDGNRIQSALSITPNGANYLLKSVLTTTNATEGVHSAVTVISVTAN